ncbi:hypothetical protein [Fructilactobacillus sanfranciscensis]|uniref:hypothetical protein n=1 Tax=Fructilactobacillus sanfranciscensis TaxID=1625 RepID=UPI000CD4385C|nr:hypothetical protein [Fructilactobacillus sanfranciscensis]NDR70280.1 hypothetical protein [Fructilactobacillus sanfranciscensis]NDS16903.1 hypothetical protein [Fructilactobacillus sanfranciscensis]POH21247.1 hypothetical protein BGL46_06510 [Fructilactobacillus sanfranciscensis]
MFEIQRYIQKWNNILKKLAKFKYLFFISMIAIIFLTASVVVYQGGIRNFMMLLFGILIGLLAALWVIFTLVYRDAKKIITLLNLNDLSSLGNLPQFGSVGKMTGAIKYVAKANLIFGLLVLFLIIFAIISLIHSSLFVILVFMFGVLGGIFSILSLIAKFAEKKNEFMIMKK